MDKDKVKEDADLTAPLPELPESPDSDADDGMPASSPRSFGCGDSCEPPRGKLFGCNWLEGISDTADFDIVQVQFKNTRSGFYRNVNNLPLKIGDTVAVEANPGHDIGQVTMVGRLVKLQMKKTGFRESDIRKVFRFARPSDLEKFEEAKAREHDTMIRSRKIAEELGLNMKIGDVEYQGDGGKAIFYYIADERVDFRKLIRILADTFHIRIEMKQIGARQEAGRIGGIGPCGRPLCCASWLSNFVSVGTSAARFQDISMNPQKLAGQCGKLKCCLNFEVDVYMESQRKMPPKDAVLQTKDADYFQFKTDILKREITYSTDKSVPANLTTLPARRAFEIISLNKQGIKVDSLLVETAGKDTPAKEFIDLVGQDSLTRFDRERKKKKKKNSTRKQPQGQTDTKAENASKPQAVTQEKEAPQPQPRRNKPKVRPDKTRQPQNENEPRKNRNRQPRKQQEPRQPQQEDS